MPVHLPTYEEPREFAAADGVTWRRTGACNRCGACCRTGNPFPELVPEVAGACAHYRDDAGDGLPGCASREHWYATAACAPFPQKPQQIAAYPECSYVFERVG